MLKSLLKTFIFCCLLAASSCSKDREVTVPGTAQAQKSSSEEDLNQPQVSEEEKKQVHDLKASVKTENGKITQKSSEKVLTKRLHFSFQPQKDSTILTYKGFEESENFKVKNPLSVPEKQQDQFYAVLFKDKEDKVLWDTVIPQSLFYKKFEEDEKYLITFLRGGFFVDLPSDIKLSEISKVLVSHLGDGKEKILTTLIQEPSLPYKKPEKAEDGWTGESKVFQIHGSTPSERAFDLTILVDGFTKEELSLESKEALMSSKLGADLKRIVLPLLEGEPYKQVKDQINIWVVVTPSKESGADNLIKKIYKKTVYDAAFGSLCVERALLVRDQQRALEFASMTPFDQIIVLVNSKKHGGVGQEISTFSVSDSAPEVMAHELAHSVGRMADEYSYFTDSELYESCEDNRGITEVSNLLKSEDVNGFYEDDSKLAPNVTLYSSKEQAKWSQYLTEESPIVFFDYPVEKPLYDEADNKLKVNIQLQSDRENLYLMFGDQKSFTKDLSSEVQTVTINNQALSFELVKPGSYTFLYFENVHYLEGDELEIEIQFKKPETEEQKQELNFPIEALLFNRNLLTLPSQSFKGTIDEIGLFQGSWSNLQKTFRPTYTSKMMDAILEPFNQVQIDAYLEVLKAYTEEKTLD